MNQLEAMQIYVRVAELASFTQAADSLGLSKASISTAIRQLEAELGTRLLHRTTRKVQMTPDGTAFYNRCREVLGELEELHTMFVRDDAELSGRLRVDMPLGTARNMIIPRLPEFLGAHPRLHLELSSTDRRVDVVAEGFDCILRVGQLDDSSLVARPLGHFRMINCASPGYVERCGLPLTLDDLGAHRLIDYTPALGGRSALFEYEDGDTLRTREMAAALAVNNSDAYQAACLAGLGIIQVPQAGVRELIEQGRLVEVLPDYRAAPMPVTLLYAHRRHLSKRVQRFMQWLADTMAPHLA
jgi:DNA-binding transcriptional LysR family regulator